MTPDLRIAAQTDEDILDIPLPSLVSLSQHSASTFAGLSMKVAFSEINLDKIKPDEVTQYEISYTQRLNLDQVKLGIIHTGNNELEIVSASDAVDFRRERKAFHDNLATESRSTLDPTMENSRILLCSPGQRLALSVAAELGFNNPSDLLNISRFPNGETKIDINDTLSGKIAFVFMGANGNPNDRFMDTMFTINAAIKSRAKDIIVLMPFYQYNRGDKNFPEQRQPSSAKVVADMLTEAGASKVVTVDEHCQQSSGFFDDKRTTYINVPASIFFADYLLKNRDLTDVVLVAPDIGATPRVDELNKRLKWACVTQDCVKRRARNGAVTSVDFKGDAKNIEGKIVIVADDILDTGGTLKKTLEEIGRFNPREIILMCTHGILSGNALENLRTMTKPNSNELVVSQLILSDTIDPRRPRNGFVKSVSASGVIAEVMRRLATPGESIRDLLRIND